MKILFLSAANSIHTVRWVNSLAENGNEVHLVYNSDHQSIQNKIDEKVIQHKLKYGGNLGYYLNAIEVSKIYKKINPDIVNAHYASGYGTLARVAGLKNLLLSVWGSDVYDFPYQSIIKMCILKKNINYATYIASTSMIMGKQVEKIMDKNMEILITPFGVDIQKFKYEPKTNVEFTFGVVKTLDIKYGIEYIIKAFSILLEKIKIEKLEYNPILKIYGDGKIKNELKELCKNLNITQKVVFEGYIPNTEVPKALNEMDIFCLGSILNSESFGVAAVEAMSCEIPVIASDVDGFKEVMVDRETGYIVPKMDQNIMAERMYELMIDDKKRNKMGKMGRARVEELYNWDNNVENMEQIYRRIIKKNRG